jgi:hypothetical protein
MPPLPPINSVLKLSLQYKCSSSAVIAAANVLHLQYPSSISAFTATDCVAVANGSFTWWLAHFAPSICASYTLNQVVVTAVDGSGVQGISTHAAAAGTLAETALPPQCSKCISWVGAPAYRGGKPRTYLPGASTLDILPGTSTLVAARCTTLKTAAVAALGDVGWTTIGGVTGQLGTVSYVKKSLVPEPPHRRPVPLFWAYLSANVHERIDSQRRRSGKESAFIEV